MKKMTTATSFGAAVAAMYAAPGLHADVISLTFSPDVVSYSGGAAVSVLFNELGVVAGQWNDSIGQTALAGSLDGGIAAASVSNSLAASTFVGSTGIGFTASQTGTVYVGFSHMGNVGWYSLHLGGIGGEVTYLEGAYGSMGENVHVGTVPAPGALALMALGAVGIRRKRAA